MGKRQFGLCIGVIAQAMAVSVSWGQTLPGFGSFSPDRGFMPYGSYALSDTESINEEGGGLTLTFPLATLPPGRGGFRQGIQLVYNSQLFELKSESISVNNVIGGCAVANCPAQINALTQESEKGGWQYSFQYRFEVEQRPGLESGACVILDGAPVEYTWAVFKYTLILPDGSSHLLRLVGSTDNAGDGYYRHDFAGGKACPNQSSAALPYPLRFYTTDGTFIQVTKDANGWRAQMRDGTSATGTGLRANRICDRNLNCVNIVNGFDEVETTKPVTSIVDDFGRQIRIKYNIFTQCQDPPNCYTSSDDIYQAAYGGDGAQPTATPSLHWSVVWGGSPVGSVADPALYSCSSPSNGQSYTCGLNTSVRNVTELIPPQGAALKYSFLYADNNAPEGRRGWGEMREMRLPNANPNGSDYRPRVEYVWQFRPEIGGQQRSALFDSKNYLASKTIQRTETLEGTPTNLTEPWSYTFPQPGVITGTITAPDNGITRNYFNDGGVLPGMKGLRWKTETPDGSVTETFWAINEPWIGTTANGDRKNAYARAEMRKLAGAGQYSATTFVLDKNGNLKSQTDLGFGVTITRDAAGRPNAMPTGSAMRSTEHDYNYETQTADGALAGSYAGTDANSYWKNFAPLVRGSRKRTTVRNSVGGAEAATDFYYDDVANAANLTSEARWDDTRAATLPGIGLLSRAGNNAVVTDYQWSQGNLVQQTSPAGDVTMLTYGQPHGCPTNYVNLYPTRATLHGGQGSLVEEQDYRHDCASGILKERQAEPGQGAKAIVAVGSYDAYGRILLETTGTGTSGSNLLRQSQTAYDDTSRQVRMAASLESAGDLRLSSVSFFDGLGRLEKSLSNDDTGGAVIATSTGGLVAERATRYVSGVGRYEVESKPWRPSPEAGVTQPPRAWVRKKLDQAGRLLLVETFAGAGKPGPWGTNSDVMSSVAYSYSGSVMVETDAAGRTREETRDALGRLISVKQGALNPVGYGYNGRDLLTLVTQVDTSSYGTGKTQARQYVYDSLGRLKNATNPESGTQHYEYELDGLLKKRTDARGVWMALSYDGARRLKGKTYSDGTAAVVYCYDGEVYGNGTCGALAGRVGDAADYPKGRLTGVGNTNGWTNQLRMDALGRGVLVTQGVAGLPSQSLSYEYAANGALKAIVYPGGRRVSYGLTDRGQTKEVNGLMGGQSVRYLSFGKYGSGGEWLEGKFGDEALAEKRTYSAMSQVTEMAVTRGATLVGRLNFDYGATGNNGNLKSQQITTPTRTFAQYYGYDPVNRLRIAWEGPLAAQNPETATCVGIQGTWPAGQWCQRLGYDEFANAWGNEQVNLAGLAANGPAWYLHQSGAVNNQIKDVGYDVAGNQTQYLVNNLQRVADYDGEGRIWRVRETGTSPQTLAEYSYDGEGRRVKRVTGGETTFTVYDMQGRAALEYQAGGTWTGTAGVKYWFTDHLGSTRMRLKADGTEVSRADYEPFGAEIVRTGEGYGSSGENPRKFTGKERDAETGLDYFGARYFSAAQGRFTSPDPLFFQKEMLVDSQRWNLYTYVRNNPLRFIDPTGERIELTGESEDERRRQLAAIQGTVGKEAGSRLTIQEDKKTGQFFVGITGDVSTFREINSAASTFATIIGLNEVAKFDIVGSAQRLNISWTGADGSPQNTLMQARAEGAAGRDATGQLWVYVKQPREGYADVEASKMGSRFFGGFRDQSTVVGHEFGHALGFMMQRLASETTNSAATNQESLSLENKVRQVQRPGSPPRLRH